MYLIRCCAVQWICLPLRKRMFVMKSFAVMACVCYPYVWLLGSNLNQHKEQQPKKADEELVSGTTKKQDVALTAKLPARSRISEPIKLIAILHNQSKEKVRVLLGERTKLEARIVDSQKRVTLLTRYGKEMYPPGPPLPGSGVSKVLAPGESM